MSPNPKLPLELILQVIASLLPPGRGTIHEPSSAITRTLLSLTQVCWALHPVASNYLRQHCAYIDSAQRLRQFITCIESTDAHKPVHSAVNRSPITSLYLAPFTDCTDHLVSTALDVRHLCGLVQHSLQRLIVDIDAWALKARDASEDAVDALREGLCWLTRVEEFVSLHADLDMWDRFKPGGSEIWTLWPRLRRLSLDASEIHAGLRFWSAVRRMNELQTVVLTRPGSSTYESDGSRANDLVYYKSGYLQASLVDKAEVVEPARKLTVVLVGVAQEQPPHIIGRRQWDAVDPDDTVTLSFYDAPMSPCECEESPDLFKRWIRPAVLRGDIWEWEGAMVAIDDKEERSLAERYPYQDGGEFDEYVGQQTHSDVDEDEASATLSSSLSSGDHRLALLY